MDREPSPSQEISQLGMFWLIVRSESSSFSRSELWRRFEQEFEFLEWILIFLDPTEISVFNIASDDSLERSIQFVNERYCYWEVTYIISFIV